MLVTFKSFSLKKGGNSHTCHHMMNLEDMMLSEISQTQKDKYCMLPFMFGSYSGQNLTNRGLPW